MVSDDRHRQAMDKVRALVNVRERSLLEIRKRLERANFTLEEIKDAIETSLRCNLVSNRRFASAYIRGKTHLGWGKSKIIQNLQKEGISEEDILACSDDFPSQEDEYQRAFQILAKRPSNAKNKYQSYLRRLISKGYTFDMANKVVHDFISFEH